MHKKYAEISKTYKYSRSKLKTCKQLGQFLITYLHWWCNIHNNKYSLEQNNIAYLLYIRDICTIFFFFFLCSKALIAEEKLIHVETPGSYQLVALSEFCITPSEDQTLKFDVKARCNAITHLSTDSGVFYEIVIGGKLNKVAILRRGSPGILGEKQYVYVGLYQTRISVLFRKLDFIFPLLFLSYYIYSTHFPV